MVSVCNSTSLFTGRVESRIAISIIYWSTDIMEIFPDANFNSQCYDITDIS